VEVICGSSLVVARQSATHPHGKTAHFFGFSAQATPARLTRLDYRQIIKPPCRIFYRFDSTHVFILYVMRGEMLLQRRKLIRRDKQTRPRH
jgi:hypothetical protein